MRKIFVSLMLVGSIIGFVAPASAITGVPSSFSISAYGTNGVSCGFIVNGLFYYYNGYSSAMITALDVARQVKGTISFNATSARVITSAL